MINVYEELRETSRRRILAELRAGAKSVNDLVRVTGLKQPNVSNHLCRMRFKGIVRHIKMGREVYYSLSSPEMEAAISAVLALRPGCCDGVEMCPLVDRFVIAAIEGDECAASEVMDEAFRANAGMLEIYQDLLAPAMYRVGELYQAGEIDEGHEHLASEITLRMMGRTVQLAGPSKRTGKTAIVGGGPQAMHTIGMRMTADFLKLSGWRSLYLGGNVPIRSYLTAVLNHKPSLALVGCGSDDALDKALELITELHRLRRGETPYLIGIGGYVVSQNAKPFFMAGADFVVSNLRSFACKVLPEVERTGFVTPRS
jgi:methanogenic corrinoid protein MtbC1